MKNLEKIEARRLRTEEGLSIRVLSKKLGVSKSSISLWVKDIELSDNQKKFLAGRSSKAYLKNTPFLKRGQVTQEKYLKLRRKYQEEGRKLIDNCDRDFIAGLMLFWAEGDKNRNLIGMTNGDPLLLKVFVNFLRRFFSIKNNDISFRIRWYSDNYLSFEEVKKFWFKTLDLEEVNLRKCYIDYQIEKGYGKKKGRLPYGIGRITIHNTRIQQTMVGALKAYIGINDDRWLF